MVGSVATKNKPKISLLRFFIDIPFIKINSVKDKSNLTKVIGSRSHSNKDFDNWINDNCNNFELIQIGSSLKFCYLAESKANIYPRLGPTSEWDIAAGHIILEEAGGSVCLLYTSPSPRDGLLSRMPYSA